MHRADNLFQSASQSTTITSIPTIVSFGLSIAILVCSALQASTIYPDYVSDADARTTRDTCKNELIEYLSPFRLQEVTSGGIYGCQWRPRNTIFRCIIACCMMLTCCVSLVLLFSGKFGAAWPAVYWGNWLLFVMMFVVFVLDCDAINTGLNSCNQEFTVGDVTLVYYYDTATGQPMEYKCLVTPFIWTAICDLAASIMIFCAYKISRYYIFDPQQRKASIQARKTSMNEAKHGGESNGTQVAMNNGGQMSTQQKEDSPDPFAEFQGSYATQPNANGAGAGQVAVAISSAYDE